MTARVSGKKQLLQAYLRRGLAMLHIDARRPGVSVPPQFRHEAHLRLNLSYRYNIHDLIIDDAHVQATLSFGGRPFQCQLPWASVFAITTNAGEGQVWPEDLPVEVTAETEEALQPVEPRRPALAAVESDARPSAQEESPKPSGAPQKRHLRLVR